MLFKAIYTEIVDAIGWLADAVLPPSLLGACEKEVINLTVILSLGVCTSCFMLLLVFLRSESDRIKSLDHSQTVYEVKANINRANRQFEQKIVSDFSMEYGAGDEESVWDETCVPELKSAVDKNNLPSPLQMHNLILQRRSVFPKDYSGQKVPIEVIKDILCATNWAPTHGNTQPWRFVVVGQNKLAEMNVLKRKIAIAGMDSTEEIESFEKKMDSKEKNLVNVSVAIFICVKRVKSTKGKLMPMWEEMASVSMAVQNLHLQLTTYRSQGYCGYWSSGGYNGWLNAPETKKILDMNGSIDGEEDKVMGIFYIGHCDPEKIDKYNSKRKPIGEKVTWLN